MSITIILGFMLLQFLVQFFMYKQVMRLVKYINKPCKKCLKEEAYKTFLTCEMVILNILISILVLTFTAAGAIAGMTNLAASLLVGVFMWLDVKLEK